MKNIIQVQSALRCCLTLGLLVPGNTLRAAESGEPGEPFLIQTKPDRPGDPVCEMVLDEGGIELLWRVHFGFFDPVEAGKDTDGDGVSDADEEKNWTNPKHMNEPGPAKSPAKRRQEVIDAMWTPPIILNGKPATPGELLAHENAPMPAPAPGSPWPRQRLTTG